MRALRPLLPAQDTPRPQLPPEAPALATMALIDGPQVTGLPATYDRLGGIVVHPASRVLGLRAFDDTFEGTLDAVPWVAFDLEKILRMGLHRSTLAWRILVAAPQVLMPPALEARAIASSLTCRDHVRPYLQQLARLRDTTARGLDADDQARLATLSATALALARDAVACLHVPSLLEAFPDWPAALRELAAACLEGALLDRASLTQLLDEVVPLIEAGRALPEQVPDYDGLDALLVAARLA